MNPKTIIIALLVVVVVLLSVVGYLLLTQNPPSNNTSINNTTGNVSTKVQNTTQVTPTISESKVNITPFKAKAIASDYLASDPNNKNLASGTPSLKGGIYYVPMVVTNNEGQHEKGTVVGFVKVDGETGDVFGIQEIYMY